VCVMCMCVVCVYVVCVCVVCVLCVCCVCVWCVCVCMYVYVCMYVFIFEREQTEKSDKIRSLLLNATSYRKQGRYSMALSELEEAEKIDPKNKQVQTAIGETRKECNTEKLLDPEIKCR